MSTEERYSITLELTKDEARYLAMHAVYEANGQLDARRYLTSEIEVIPGGPLVQKLSADWDTRDERAQRWNEIADALHPGPIWSEGSR